MEKFEAHINWNSEEIEDMLKFLLELQWDSVCIVAKKDELKEMLSELKNLKENFKDLEIFSGIVIHENIRANSRRYLDKVDFIFVDPTKSENPEKVVREASKSWEVDILSRVECYPKRDFMKQRNSGIDAIIAKLLAEKKIGLEFNFSNILNTSGKKRALLLGRMKQNVRLARKYKMLSIITSGASNRWEIRNPHDLVSFGRVLRMTDQEAKEAVFKNPVEILEKIKRRNDPNILLQGLEVVKWGSEKPRKKRKYGWY